MELAETNEELFKENKYITQKSYSKGFYAFLDIDELKKTGFYHQNYKIERLY